MPVLAGGGQTLPPRSSSPPSRSTRAVKAGAANAASAASANHVTRISQAIRAVKALARDDRIPHPLRGLVLIGLAPIPGPFDEAILVLAAVLLFAFYRPLMLEAW